MAAMQQVQVPGQLPCTNSVASQASSELPELAQPAFQMMVRNWDPPNWAELQPKDMARGDQQACSTIEAGGRMDALAAIAASGGLQ